MLLTKRARHPPRKPRPGLCELNQPNKLGGDRDRGAICSMDTDVENSVWASIHEILQRGVFAHFPMAVKRTSVAFCA